MPGEAALAWSMNWFLYVKQAVPPSLQAPRANTHNSMHGKRRLTLRVPLWINSPPVFAALNYYKRISAVLQSATWPGVCSPALPGWLWSFRFGSFPYIRADPGLALLHLGSQDPLGEDQWSVGFLRAAGCDCCLGETGRPHRLSRQCRARVLLVCVKQGSRGRPVVGQLTEAYLTGESRNLVRTHTTYASGWRVRMRVCAELDEEYECSGNTRLAWRKSTFLEPVSSLCERAAPKIVHILW